MRTWTKTWPEPHVGDFYTKYTVSTPDGAGAVTGMCSATSRVMVTVGYGTHATWAEQQAATSWYDVSDLILLAPRA